MYWNSSHTVEHQNCVCVNKGTLINKESHVLVLDNRVNQAALSHRLAFICPSTPGFRFILRTEKEQKNRRIIYFIKKNKIFTKTL